MGWASEQFWKDLARLGIYPNVPDRKAEPEERRCGKCKEKGTCPAYNTGVLDPCPYYKEEQPK